MPPRQVLRARDQQESRAKLARDFALRAQSAERDRLRAELQLSREKERLKLREAAAAAAEVERARARVELIWRRVAHTKLYAAGTGFERGGVPTLEGLALLCFARRAHEAGSLMSEIEMQRAAVGGYGAHRAAVLHNLAGRVLGWRDEVEAAVDAEAASRQERRGAPERSREAHRERHRALLRAAFGDQAASLGTGREWKPLAPGGSGGSGTQAAADETIPPASGR